MRSQIAAANWKMNLTWTEANHLLNELVPQIKLQSGHQVVILAVPFPYLISVKEKIKTLKNVFVAAQNCYSKESGAFTGEVSAAMLKSIDVQYVILGHSERREYFQEDNAMLAEKINICLANGIKPIFCCGESLPIRERDAQNRFVENQLKESLFHLTEEQISNFIIAYEPIWAIGTGKTATNEQAQEMHAHIRKVFANKYSVSVADSISILYGGSVKSSNAGEIFSMPDVDGGLVGGASLIADDFAKIIAGLK